MDLHVLKVELTKRIMEIESEDLLTKILNELIDAKNDFYDNLTEAQKMNIEKSRKQIREGDSESWEVLKKRYL